MSSIISAELLHDSIVVVSSAATIWGGYRLARKTRQVSPTDWGRVTSDQNQTEEEERPSSVRAQPDEVERARSIDQATEQAAMESRLCAPFSRSEFDHFRAISRRTGLLRRRVCLPPPRLEQIHKRDGG